MNVTTGMRDRSANRRFWAVLIFIVNIGFLGFVISGSALGENSHFLIALAFFILSLPAYYQYLSSEREIFSPLNLVFANLFIGVLIQTVMISFDLDLAKTLALNAILDFEVILNGLLALTVAVFFLLVGYGYSPSSSRYRPHQEDDYSASIWVRKRLIVMCILFCGITLLSVVYFVISFDVLSDLSRFSVKRRSEDVGGTGILRFGMRFSQVACLVMLTYHLACKRDGFRSGVVPYIVVAFILASAGPILSSSRSLLLYFIIAIFAVHHFSTGGWKIRNVGYAVLVASIIISVMGGLRYAQQRSVSLQAFQEEVGVAGSFGKVASSNNFLGIKKTAVLMDIVPSEVPHTYGTTYLLWMITPIPRSIWPEKPIVRIGGVLGEQVFGTRETNGIPPGFVGEAYLNFGWLGIPLVALCFGVIFRKFFESYGRNCYSSPRSILIYSILFVPIVFSSLSSDFTGFISRSGQIIIPLIIAFWFLGIHKKDIVSR